MACAQGDLPLAFRNHQEALALYRETCDKGGVAASMAILGGLSAAMGSLEEAKSFADEAVRLRARRVSPISLQARCPTQGMYLRNRSNSSGHGNCMRRSLA